MANSLFLAKTVLMSWIVICFMINVSSDDYIPDHFTSKLIKLTRTFRSWFLKCQEKVREICYAYMVGTMLHDNFFAWSGLFNMDLHLYKRFVRWCSKIYTGLEIIVDKITTYRLSLCPAVIIKRVASGPGWLSCYKLIFIGKY